MNNPVALITGAARGIGRGIATKLAENGFDVVVDDVFDQSEVTLVLEEMRQKGSRVRYIQADISQSEQRNDLVAIVRREMGRLDLLVNNAGVAPKQRIDILQANEESYDRVMNINLKGPYFLTQLVANWMIEQKQSFPDRQCQIINIGSLSSYASSPARGEYCLSKAGISMMTKLYADRLAEFGILVFEIRPGIIETDMTRVVQEKYNRMIADGLLPIRRWGYPDDIAQAVMAIARGHLSYSTGQIINVDGGFHIPRL